MDEVSAALVRLNLETRMYHAAADAGWRALLTPNVTRSQYIAQLSRVYGFEGPLEAALAYTSNLRLVISVHERFRAGFIAQDLLALGLKPSGLARLPQCVLAPFASPLEALGWIYAAERAALLHDEVRRHLQVCLPDAKDACVYLSASEVSANVRWRELGHRIDRAVRSARLIDEVICGAQSAFRTWLGWSAREAELQQLA